VLKILGIIILTLTIVVIGIYWSLTNFVRGGISGRRGIFGKLRKLKIEIPITYNIGWWAHQNAMIIEGLDIKILESNLNLFNSKSLVSYKIKGKLKHDGSWKPSIKEIHISERLNKDTAQNLNRIIELTPIVALKEDEKLNGGIEEFEFTNQHRITSGNWGLNRLKFISADIEKIIELRQSK